MKLNLMPKNTCHGHEQKGPHNKEEKEERSAVTKFFYTRITQITKIFVAISMRIAHVTQGNCPAQNESCWWTCLVV